MAHDTNQNPVSQRIFTLSRGGPFVSLLRISMSIGSLLWVVPACEVWARPILAERRTRSEGRVPGRDRGRILPVRHGGGRMDRSSARM